MMKMPHFGEKRFKKAERSWIANECNQSRPFASPSTSAKKDVAQCTSDLINKANSIFGFNGWSHTVSQQTIDFIELENGKYDVGVSALVKVMLKDGTFHEDIGYGIAKGLKCKGTAIGKARKTAAADALKNALQSFGKAFGNSFPSGKITDYLPPSQSLVQNNAKRQLRPEFENEGNEASGIPCSPSTQPMVNGHDIPRVSLKPTTSQTEASLFDFFKTPFTDNLSQEEKLPNMSPQKDLLTDRDKRKRRIKQLEMEIASREKYKNELLMQDDFDDELFTSPVVKQERMDM